MSGKTTFKTYAKEAKDRLRSGFWEKKHDEWDMMESKARQNGTTAKKAIEKERAELSVMLYNRKKYEDDKRFYDKVCEIMEMKEIVTNPISILCEIEGVNDLPDGARIIKTMEISEKYQKMVRKYEKEHPKG